MPLYTVLAEDGTASDHVKRRIAQEIRVLQILANAWQILDDGDFQVCEGPSQLRYRKA
jgi:hypothetical protein